jgi:hypothetical protein
MMSNISSTFKNGTKNALLALLLFCLIKCCYFNPLFLDNFGDKTSMTGKPHVSCRNLAALA